ncbi:Transporter [Prochlorococcus sp. SS52]|nr:Transporter [Prochlorococcus sp. SS52]
MTSIPKQLNPFITLNPLLQDLINLSLGLTVPLLGILLIGLMARNFVGRWLLEFGEGTVSRIPLAGSVYKTLKQLLETFLGDNASRFRRVVLVEYPREGLFSVGFVTGLVGPTLQAELNEPLLSVFIPTAPNPTTGWYTLVPESSVKDLNISVEDAFRTIISAGIVNPDERNNSTNASFSSLLQQFRSRSTQSSLTKKT